MGWICRIIPAFILIFRDGDVLISIFRYMSNCVRKLTFCICENKDTDQLRGNREAV